jgi:hypothetical protein
MLDLDHEESGWWGQAEAQDKRRTDSCTERYMLVDYQRLVRLLAHLILCIS